jgi:RHS repeat-associated protein
VLGSSKLNHSRTAIEKSGGPAGTVLRFYDEAGHTLGEYNSTGGLVQETVWLGDIPVATIRPNGSTVTVYYVHADHMGAPRMITQPSSNKIAWRWDIGPYGNVAPNQNPAGLGTFVYNLRFPGQYYDTETALNYNGFRDYDAANGRYVESDPLGLDGGIDTYTYADANPVSSQDSLGLLVPSITPATGLVTLEWVAATAVGTYIYNANATAIQDALEKAFPYPTKDPGLQQEIERKANEREYHRRCNEPPPVNSPDGR